MNVEVFWSRVVRTESCWLWTGSHDEDGYGSYGRTNGSSRAHRIAYELCIGPIPEGLTIDHLCRVRNCVNPAHLEPVDNRTNVLRGVGHTAINARKTHCKRGHRFTPENTYIEPARGVRVCRKCVLFRARWKARRRRFRERMARRERAFA